MSKWLPEEIRIKENLIDDEEMWSHWGPYVSERMWGTVREDYSLNGKAWKYITHDMARHYAYQWGEEGIGAISDHYQELVFAPAFWNHQDSMLKERLFGLDAQEGNHGEDVKEVYFHLENVPSHAYMRYLYKYPQCSFPYEELVKKNESATKKDREVELYDLGVFNDQKYFDIFIEYAKVREDDIFIKIEVHNRGKKEAAIDVLGQLFFRNRWEWTDGKVDPPEIVKGEQPGCVVASDEAIEKLKGVSGYYSLGKYFLYGSDNAEIIFTNNETNNEVLFKKKNNTPFVVDAFDRYVVHDQSDAINPKMSGTKVAFLYKDNVIKAGESQSFYFRLSSMQLSEPLENAESFFSLRRQEMESFYEKKLSHIKSEEEKNIGKMALSGLLWQKQFYLYKVRRWLKGKSPKSDERNKRWQHIRAKHIILMPDKWEYPWFAAWDLAFHCISMSLIDVEFAKEQLLLLLNDQYQHPSGQIPAYEWNFSDLNPPVQAFAAMKIFQNERRIHGKEDLSFLKRVFQRLVLNFIWWVNREDDGGKNIFEGGFLGFDNISVIDRSHLSPKEGMLEQSDATGWMSLYALNLMRMAIELSKKDKDYEWMVEKFFKHFIYISHALKNSDQRKIQNWNEKDGFFYDVLSHPDGKHEQIPVRSLVGLIPLTAIEWISEEEIRSFENFFVGFEWFIKMRKDLVKDNVIPYSKDGKKGYILSCVTPEQAKKIFSKMWDKNEFHSDYGIRSLSKYYEKNTIKVLDHRIRYEPGESVEKIYGGNSNWRGPIWMPINYLLIQTMRKYQQIFQDGFEVDNMKMDQMIKQLSEELVSIFKGSNKKKPFQGENNLFYEDPHFNDYLLFYEHFHGDTGRGLGASHQTGWTALISNILDEYYT